MGLVRGVHDFPSDLLLVFSGCLIFFQLSVIAQRNHRIFHGQLIQLALTAAKVAMCVG